MNLFGFGKKRGNTVEVLAVQVERLTAQVHDTQSTVRTLEAEQIALHDQVRKWMRRAVAAERNQERGGAAAPATPAPAAALPWGAQGRILARARRAPQLALEEGESNGVHS